MKPRAVLFASSLALALAALNPTEARAAGSPHVDLDALFTYGLGNGSTLGALLHGTVSLDAWRTSRALGTVELGAWAGYQNEPLSLQPWVTGNSTTGTTHRLPFAFTVGHSFRFGADDRLSFGVHLYAGLVHWRSDYQLNLPSRGFSGAALSTAVSPDVGAFLRFTWRPHPNVGLSLQAGAPFYGVGPETVVGLFTVGGGVSLRFR